VQGEILHEKCVDSVGCAEAQREDTSVKGAGGGWKTLIRGYGQVVRFEPCPTIGVQDLFHGMRKS